MSIDREVRPARRRLLRARVRRPGALRGAPGAADRRARAAAARRARPSSTSAAATASWPAPLAALRPALHAASTRASEMVDGGAAPQPGRRRSSLARIEDYEPPEPVDATICLRAVLLPGRPASRSSGTSPATRGCKFVFDFRPARAPGRADPRATCGRPASPRIELRPFFLPQRRRAARRSRCRSSTRSSAPARSPRSSRGGYGRHLLQRGRLSRGRRDRPAAVTRRRVIARRRACTARSALGIAGVARRPARARAVGRRPVLDRHRHRRLPLAARLADERRRARQVRVPLRDAGGLGPLPPARPASTFTLRARARRSSRPR